MKFTSLSCFGIAVALGCGGTTPPVPVTPAPVEVVVATPPALDQLSRDQFNQLAVLHNDPVFWTSDVNGNRAVDPDEIRSLLFYPEQPQWIADGAFTPAFYEAYSAMLAENARPAPGATPTREDLVRIELNQGYSTLIYHDFRTLSAEQREMVRHIMAAADRIDDLYEYQTGVSGLEERIDALDRASLSLLRRNRGPVCESPLTNTNADCSAIAGLRDIPVNVYPHELQTGEFCAALEALPNGEALLKPFTAVVGTPGQLEAVPYSTHFGARMTAVADELRAAAAAIAPSDGPDNENALKAYLLAAAQAFTDNNWDPADEAWAAMNATNSKWYLRVGPDETYWDPCSQKAGFHMTFAAIDRASLEWQAKLAPIQQDMEKAIAKRAGRAYRARQVTFHLPDFIDIVANAGDDRSPFGATIGQSLPNWGPVAAESRGRTVAMSTLYTDADSLRMYRAKANMLMVTDSLSIMSDDRMAGLLSTILHEAGHNLGPSHEYAYRGKTDDEAFGGELASMLEELKAQTISLFLLELLVEKGVITQELANRSYLDSVLWGLGHISRGMYTASGHHRMAYSQLAAIQIGFLMDEGVLSFNAEAPAANGTDVGAFSIDLSKMPAAAAKLMGVVGSIKATADRAKAEALAAKYVDSDRVPQALIRERYSRVPKQSFVYGLDL